MSSTEAEKSAYIYKATNQTLDRTTADIINGRSNVPFRQLNPEQKQMLEMARVRDQYSKGLITSDMALQRLGVSAELWRKESNERTIREGQKAARALKSETTKQDTARAKAAQQGIAIGTINENKANTSQNSQISNAKVNQFMQYQKQTSTQAQRENRVKVTTPDGKERIFKDKQTADKFIQRVGGNYTNEIQGPEQQSKHYAVNLGQKQEPFNSPYGNLDFTYGKKNNKVLAEYEKDNPLQNLGAGLYNSLRYYDAVENKEVPEPKGLEWLSFGASQALSPLYNIPLNIMGDKKTVPTLSETIFDTGYDLVTKGKTKTHDPIGDYLRTNPLGSLIQMPAEAALWVTGSKAVSVGSKAFKTFSPIQYQSKKILTSDGKPASFIRAITVNNKPVVSIQQGKIIKGYDPLKLSYDKINVSTREGFEASVGSGIEKEIFYSERALVAQQNKRIIDAISKERAAAWVKAVDQAKGVTSKGNTLGKEPIEGLTQKQSDAIFKGVQKGQKAGEIDLIHGSTATKASIPESIQKQAGSSLKLGDIDITPKGKNLQKTADKLIKSFAHDLPLTPGQRISIKGIEGGENVNRSITISGGKFKEPTKILEVVLKTSDESKYGVSQGNKILDRNIPFNKSMKVKDYPIKTHTGDYQLLTNVKQALAYQKGSTSLFEIYTSSGRTKDIVRAYWNLKAKAVYKGGDKGKALDTQAEYIRSLYPKLEFTDYKAEKVLLYSSNIPKSSSGYSKGVSQMPFRTPPVKEVNNPFDDEIKSISNKPSINQQSSRLLRYQPKPIVNSLESISRNQKRISNKVNSMSARINSNKNRPLGNSRGSINNKPSNNLDIPPSKNPFSIKNDSIFGPPSNIPSNNSMKNPPPKTPINKLLGRTPQSRGLENPYMDRYSKKPTAVIPFDIKNTTKQPKGTKKESHNFLAWTNVSSVLGVRTSKKDIDVGDKKTEKLYRDNILNNKRKYQKSDKKNSKNLLGNNKKSKSSLW